MSPKLPFNNSWKFDVWTVSFFSFFLPLCFRLQCISVRSNQYTKNLQTYLALKQISSSASSVEISSALSFSNLLINSTIDRLISSVKNFCVCVNRQNEIQFDLHCTIFFCLFPLPCRDRYLAFYSAHKGVEYTVFRTNSKESFFLICLLLEVFFLQGLLVCWLCSL